MTSQSLSQLVAELHNESLMLVQTVLETQEVSQEQVGQARALSRKIEIYESKLKESQSADQSELIMKLAEARKYLAAVQAMTEDKEEDLSSEINRISQDAFALAQAASTSRDDWEEYKQRAREINEILDRMLPEIQGASLPERQALIQDWNDARLDVGFVLSGGELATSTRLFHFLEGRKGH